MSILSPVVYSDASGQEQTLIEMEPDGEFLSMVLRGVHFRGVAFDCFYVWPENQDEKKRESFSLESGLITAGGSQPEPAHHALVDYTLQWTMPLTIVQQQQNTQELLHCSLERRGPTKEHQFGWCHMKMELRIREMTFEVTSNDPTLGEILTAFQKQLPLGTYLKCCQFCGLSREDFYGGGLLCYRRTKEEIRVLKHLVHRSKVSHPIKQLRKEALYVQAMYLCPEFEPDPVFLS